MRKALGPQAKLMVDVNCAWSPAFAIEMGREMEPYNLYWIEEPVETDDIDGSARVADALDTPIAGYETELEPLRLPRADPTAARSISCSSTSPGPAGSPRARRIAAYAQAHHRMVAPHAFAGAVLLMASLHFAASIPNGLVLEWDQNPNALRDELLKEPLEARKRRHGQTAGAPRPRHRTRPRRGRALPGRVVAGRTLFTIGYEKARLVDVIAALKGAGVETLIDVRDRPQSRRPGFSKNQLAAGARGSRYPLCRP